MSFLYDRTIDLIAFASPEEFRGPSRAMSIDAQLIWVDNGPIHMFRFVVDDEAINVELRLSHPFRPWLQQCGVGWLRVNLWCRSGGGQ